MDRQNRPHSREKNVTQGAAHVGRQDSRPAGTSPVGRPSGGARQGSGGNRASRPTVQTQTGAGGIRLPKFVVIIIIIAVAYFFIKNGGLSSLLGGGELVPDYQEPTVTPTEPVKPSAPSAAPPDTSVSGKARDRYTSLRGGGKDTVTIMVYMCGTDLESNGGFATSDLTEMTKANISDKVNLLVFTGGCKSWKNNIISSKRNEIYKVESGGLRKLWSSDSLAAMTDPDTLAGYIYWASTNYPADRNMLIFWDHGGGSISGYGYDEVNQRAGSMTLDGIADALKKGGCKFDVIGFDACLMATLETALVAEPYADYLVASEETEPGCGWYYTDWLTTLSANTSTPTVTLGKQIADDFVNTCGQVASRQQATLSVIDLAELAGTVPESFRSFAVATNESIRSGDYQGISDARSRTKEFASSSKIDQVDLIHLADNMNTPESRELASVLRSAVKYNATSRNIQNANGVSVYFPYGRTSNVSKMAATYSKIGIDSAYTDCIRSFASLEVAGQTAFGGSSMEMGSLFGMLTGAGQSSSGGSMGFDLVSGLLGSLLAGDGRSLADVGLTADEASFLDADLISGSAQYLVGHQFDSSLLKWTKKGGHQVLVLPEEQWSLVATVELNVFADDGSGYLDMGYDNVFEFNGDGDLIGDFDGTWLSVNRVPVAYYLMSDEVSGSSYKTLGRIPARLNGRDVDLIACFTDENPKGEILGAAIRYDEETETSTVAKGLLEIADGDNIEFLCDYYDYNRNYQASYVIGRLTVNGALTLANIKLDNRMIASYRVTDVYNNHYWTPEVK